MRACQKKDKAHYSLAKSSADRCQTAPVPVPDWQVYARIPGDDDKSGHQVFHRFDPEMWDEIERNWEELQRAKERALVHQVETCNIECERS